MSEIQEKLYRETDDCTAYPVFVIMRKETQVSQSAITGIDIHKIADDIIKGKDPYIDMGCSMFNVLEELTMRGLAVNLEHETTDDIESEVQDSIEKLLEELAEEEGLSFHNQDGEQFNVWSKDDEIQCDQVERCCWTREEANAWCEANKHNGSYYSYSIMAEGVLQDVVKLTCKREIERDLIGLAKDDNEDVRHGVAKNPNAPVEVLNELSKDKDWIVRQGVAENLNTPVEVLSELAKDEDEVVRYYVAINPNTPAEVLNELYKDDDWSVRQGVAINPTYQSYLNAQSNNDIEPGM